MKQAALWQTHGTRITFLHCILSVKLSLKNSLKYWIGGYTQWITQCNSWACTHTALDLAEIKTSNATHMGTTGCHPMNCYSEMRCWTYVHINDEWCYVWNTSQYSYTIHNNTVKLSMPEWLTGVKTD